MEKEVQVFVAVPLRLLVTRYIDQILGLKIKPEIGLDAWVLDTWRPSDMEGLFNRLRENGIDHTFHFPFVDMATGSPDPLIRRAVRKRFEMALQWVESYAPHAIVVHTGYYPLAHGELSQEWLEYSVETFLWLKGALKDLQVPWAIENVFEHRPEDLLLLMERLGPPPGGICLDLGHLNAFSRTPLILWMEGLCHLIEHLHLHDNKGHRDDHLGIGMGNIPFGTLFKGLSSRDAPLRTITIEPHQEEMVLPTLEALRRLWPFEDARLVI